MVVIETCKGRYFCRSCPDWGPGSRARSIPGSWPGWREPSNPTATSPCFWNERITKLTLRRVFSGNHNSICAYKSISYIHTYFFKTNTIPRWLTWRQPARAKHPWRGCCLETGCDSALPPKACLLRLPCWTTCTWGKQTLLNTVLLDTKAMLKGGYFAM